MPYGAAYVAPDAEGGGAVAASGPAVLSKFRLVDQRIGGDAASASSSCGRAGTLALGSNGPRGDMTAAGMSGS
jgi:hypothetical protein